MRKIYVVPHTHWDKEWYFTTKDSYVLADQVFKRAIELLEKDSALKFCMDGQSSIIDEFLEINHEYRDRIIKLSEKNQLELGPWYTQTDCLNVDGENILRNLVYGIYKTNKLAKHMKIAYLPDTFGFNSQMPLIVNHAGINNLIFRRGGEYSKEMLIDPLFLWKTKDGSVLNTVHIIKGYDLGTKFSDKEEYIKNSAFNSINVISEKTKTDKILFPTGNDQLNLEANLSDYVEKANTYTNDIYQISTYSEYFRDNEEYFKEIYLGELRTPEFDRVHLTIGSVRVDIKKYNWKLEQKLFKKIEPLIVLAKEFDINISTLLLYKAWERIFDSAAHDAMGGCVTDKVHEDIIARYKEAEEILDGIENIITNKLAQRLNLTENQIIIFNLLPQKFEGIKNVEYLSENKYTIVKEAKSNSIIEVITYSAEENELINNDDIYYLIKSNIEVSLPAFGYKIFNLVEGEHFHEKVNKIERENLKLEVKDNILKVLINGTKIDNFISFIDEGNDGDTYDFSPLENDKAINSRLTEWEFTRLEKLDIVHLQYELTLPYDLDERAKGKGDVNYIINVKLYVYDDNRVEVKVNFNNVVLSHRLSIIFNLNNNIEKIKKSVPFGIDEITCKKQVKPVDNNYIEYDVNNYIYDQFINIEMEEKSFITLVSNGSKEFYIENEKIKVPLISTTGEFGKSNLLYRPGRASGDTSKKGHIMLFTQRAQLLGENEFTFDIYFSREELDNKQLYKINNNTQNNTFYQWQTLNKFYNRLDNKIQIIEDSIIDNKEYSSFGINGNVQIKTITPSLYNNNAYLIRIYNPFSKDETFSFNKELNYEIVNAIEEKSDSQELIIRAYSVLTVRVWRDYV